MFIVCPQWNISPVKEFWPECRKCLAHRRCSDRMGPAHLLRVFLAVQFEESLWEEKRMGLKGVFYSIVPGEAGYQVRRMQAAGSEAGRKFYLPSSGKHASPQLLVVFSGSLQESLCCCDCSLPAGQSSVKRRGAWGCAHPASLAEP